MAVIAFVHTGKALVALPLTAEPVANISLPGKDAALVAYDIYSFTETALVVHIFTLPTHPANIDFPGIRIEYTTGYKLLEARPIPNWSPAFTTFPLARCTSTIFSLDTLL